MSHYRLENLPRYSKIQLHISKWKHILQQEQRFSVIKQKMTNDEEFMVIYVDRKYGNAYYDRYRNNWIQCAVEEHEEGRALHLDRKSGALVCYGYGHENNYIRGRRYKILEIDVDE